MSSFGRTLAGTLCGAVIGLAVQAFFLDGPPEHRIYLIVGPTSGAVILAFFALLFGGFEVRGAYRVFTVSVLGGVVTGLLGGVIWALAMALVEWDEVFREKIVAAYLRVGIVIGVPIGAFGGLITAIVVWMWRRRDRTEA